MGPGSPGCTCCGCLIDCDGVIRRIRGWNFVVTGIPADVITYEDGSGLMGFELKRTYTGYDVFNNSYTLYYDRDCVLNPLVRDDVGVTCVYRRLWQGIPGDCYCDDYEAFDCCSYPMRLLVTVDSVSLITTYDGFDPICTGDTSPAIDNNPFLFEVGFSADYCNKETVELPFTLTDERFRCDNCSYANDSGIIVVERTPIFVV